MQRAALVLVLLSGCTAKPLVHAPIAAAPVASPEANPATEPVATATPAAPIGSFQLTYYLVAEESEHRGKKSATLYGDDCKPLAKVTKGFAKDLAMEGTGKLADGRLLNWAGRCGKGRPKYRVVEAAWGLGVGNRPLAPFRSIATDPAVIATGTTVYVAELDGVTMPGAEPWGAFVHDGCVEAVDIGGRIRDRHIDFFAGTRAAYRSLDRQLALTHVTVFDGAGHCAP